MKARVCWTSRKWAKFSPQVSLAFVALLLGLSFSVSASNEKCKDLLDKKLAQAIVDQDSGTQSVAWSRIFPENRYKKVTGTKFRTNAKRLIDELAGRKPQTLFINETSGSGKSSLFLDLAQHFKDTEGVVPLFLSRHDLFRFETGGLIHTKEMLVSYLVDYLDESIEAAEKIAENVDFKNLDDLFKFLKEKYFHGKPPIVFIDEMTVHDDLENKVLYQALSENHEAQIIAVVPAVNPLHGSDHIPMKLLPTQDTILNPEQLKALMRKQIKELSGGKPVVYFEMQPESVESIHAYIRARLSESGVKNVHFSPEALSALHYISVGKPSGINAVLHHLNVVGSEVGADDVIKAAKELKKENEFVMEILDREGFRLPPEGMHFK